MYTNVVTSNTSFIFDLDGVILRDARKYWKEIDRRVYRILDEENIFIKPVMVDKIKVMTFDDKINLMTSNLKYAQFSYEEMLDLVVTTAIKVYEITPLNKDIIELIYRVKKDPTAKLHLCTACADKIVQLVISRLKLLNIKFDSVSICDHSKDKVNDYVSLCRSLSEDSIYIFEDNEYIISDLYKQNINNLKIMLCS